VQREAADGNVVRDAPGIMSVAPIEALLAEGCDFERDVLPIVRERVAAKELRAALRSWGAVWLSIDVRRRRDDRQRALAGYERAGPPTQPRPDVET